MFRRVTDDVIYERLGKRPLDVGADRIARTAHAALRFLEELRGFLGSTSPQPCYSRVTDTRSFAALGAARARRRTGCSGSPRSMSSARALRTCATNRCRSSGSLRALE